jgi:hypothetical protein
MIVALSALTEISEPSPGERPQPSKSEMLSARAVNVDIISKIAIVFHVLIT